MIRCWCVWPLLTLLACAHTRQLDQQIQSLRGLTQRAREQGAYRCAPEELALSDAHVQFAIIELAEGDPARAREHLVLANANARAALRLSADETCSAKVSPLAPGAQLPPSQSKRAPAHASEMIERLRSHEPLAATEPSRTREPLTAQTDRRGRGFLNDAPPRRRRSSRKHAEI